MFTQAQMITCYSREQAIEDGVLVDVSETALEAGIKYQVAITEAVHILCDLPGYDYAGRLWDILFLFRCVARNSSGDEIRYKVRMVCDDNKSRDIMFKALVHGGDAGEPVITIMFPDQD